MNRIQSPEIYPHAYGQLVINKRDKNNNGKDSIFGKQCWESWTASHKSLILYTKIN